MPIAFGAKAKADEAELPQRTQRPIVSGQSGAGWMEGSTGIRGENQFDTTVGVSLPPTGTHATPRLLAGLVPANGVADVVTLGPLRAGILFFAEVVTEPRRTALVSGCGVKPCIPLPARQRHDSFCLAAGEFPGSTQDFPQRVRISGPSENPPRRLRGDRVRLQGIEAIVTSRVAIRKRNLTRTAYFAHDFAAKASSTQTPALTPGGCS